ncbi:hypothetical protein [Streptomyces sp. NL15-2K]|uniref:hypothetical protein n=1 Tax=Streptomyces sp. NL15-2K TaxID=376149 RepID=UPI000F55C597|nr:MULTISPECIES: hypothetical protein [Actinomycetes]WKX09797.1 hypothetical protein Q4V64_20805 [Kutzneria buriramensis]
MLQYFFIAVGIPVSALVRPYLTAYEREEKARLQRLHRDILWCATYGVDLDTRDIHACLGAAS